ncbi:hypothetical protein [Kosakonia radicincitans]|uniref:hypothetical protein n=1 Tax=Kosakonia radicincitans TaxID=283686 RepID=UPI0012EC683D|nr:hypothetical protein [Kosakonia radicincitans]
MPKSLHEVMDLSCEQCDEMFQECTNEVPPDAPAGYLQCQLLWEACKRQCKGASALTAEEVDRIVRSKVELP